MAKTASTATSNNNGTTTTKIPAEIRNRGSQITNAAMNEYMDPGRSYQPYRQENYADSGEARTGQLNDFHTQAGDNFSAASSSYQPYINDANSTATNSAANNSAFGIDDPNYSTSEIERFRNPHEDLVVQRGVGDIEEAVDRQLAQVSDQAGRSKAFGGSRHGVQEALTREYGMDAVSDFVANQRNQGFNNAVDQYNTDFGQLVTAQSLDNSAAGQNWAKDLSLSQLYANLGQQTQDQQIAAGNSQFQLGNFMTAQDQAQRDNSYQSYLDEREYPMSTYERLAGLNASQPTNRTSTTTGTTTQENSTGPGSWIGPAIGLAGTVMASDESAKENIEDLDPEEVLGAFGRIQPKTYDYTEDARGTLGDLAPSGRRRGFMAQDQEKQFGKPSGPTVGGYKTVDIGNLVGDLVTAIHGLEKRTRSLKRA